MEEQACKTPLKDLKQGALDHYEELASKAHHWNTSIPFAIEFYYDHLITQEKLALKIKNMEKYKLPEFKTFKEEGTFLFNQPTAETYLKLECYKLASTTRELDGLRHNTYLSAEDIIKAGNSIYEALIAEDKEENN